MDTVFLILRVVLSLAAVLAVIWFVQRRVSRGGGRLRAQKAITVIGRQAVGSKASVAVIEVGGQRFLLGVTDHAVNILHTAPAPSAESTSDAFSRVLAEAGTPTTEIAPALAASTAAPAADPAIVAAELVPAKGPLAGSILSADTWKRAFASLTS
jgi:flagellar protein FliO/FliZ